MWVRQLMLKTDILAYCDDLRCLRALIVGGQHEDRRKLATMLETCGFDCVEATDGMNALRFSSDMGVDLVITAAEMPRLAGAELMGLINRGLFGPQPPPTLLWGDPESNNPTVSSSATMSIGLRCDIDELRAALAGLLPVD